MIKSAQLLVSGLVAVLVSMTFASAASAQIRHTVSPGDTLSYLAQVYVVTVTEIAELNGIPNPNLIFPGQDLLIPGSAGGESGTGSLEGSYTVVAGDTLSAIAAHFDIATADLQAANGLEDPDYLYVGQLLRVPGAAAAPSEEVPELVFPARPDNPEIEAMIEELSAVYGVDSRLVKAVATVESAWNQGAVSPAGAVGVMQIMPGTAAFLEADVFRFELYEDTSAYDNVKMGVAYLDLLLDATGSERNAVAAYYQGLSPTEAGVFYRDTQNYVATVMAARLAYWP